jgi:hypothetical protein
MVMTSEIRREPGGLGIAAPRIPARLSMTRNEDELPVRTAVPQEAAASNAAAVRVRVMIRMRVIVPLTGLS